MRHYIPARCLATTARDTELRTLMQRNEYLAFRRRFQPERIVLVIVAESPPASGKYFYNPTGSLSEPLFAALMKELGFTPATKESGLREFQRRGWVLVDATYEPVNSLSAAARENVIAEDYPQLRDDLAELLPDRSTPLVLVKANVCDLLEPKLTEDGFNVLNKGRAVYFPSHGRQPDFHRQFSAILKSAETSTNGSGNSLLPAIKHFATDVAFPFIKDAAIAAYPHVKEIVIRGITEFAQSKMPDLRTTPENSDQSYVTANEIADEYGLDQMAYRQALRDQDFPWHPPNNRWRYPRGGPEHHTMLEVAANFAGQN